MYFTYLHHFCANQLETFEFEPLDDIPYEPPLNPVGLDHDERTFPVGHEGCRAGALQNRKIYILGALFRSPVVLHDTHTVVLSEFRIKRHILRAPLELPGSST